MQNRTILLVDDDEDLNLQLKLKLEDKKFAVISAYGKEEAITKLSKHSISLAVIDLMMEQKDSGFILAHHIKKLDPAIPVILVTAVTSETGIKFGVVSPEEKKWIKADVILPKPIRYEQLLGEIERLIV